MLIYTIRFVSQFCNFFPLFIFILGMIYVNHYEHIKITAIWCTIYNLKAL